MFTGGGGLLGYVTPIGRPDVKEAASVTRWRMVKTGPPPPVETEFTIALERAVGNRPNPGGYRLYCALSALLAFSSLCFADAAQVECLFDSGTALCGSGVNAMDKTGELMSPPPTGLSGTTNWSMPILDFGGRLNYNKANRGQFKSLFPHVGNEWKIALKRSASFGLVQSKLTKIAMSLGYTNKYNLHSFRGWGPTCANQLNPPREERERLGHWAPGGMMPDSYDKAVCATELKLRGEIFSEIRPGWRPPNAFQVRTPERPANTQTAAGSETESDTSETSTSPHIKDERVNDITNLNGE